MRDLGLDVDPRAEVGRLGTGHQQLVEIAKALSHKASILVLDEPTAALTNAEAEKLFAILANLRAQGIAMIYISHRLEEVLSLSDRTTVLRDGQMVTTNFTNQLNVQQIIAGMVGREVSQVFPVTRRTPSDVILEVRHVCSEPPAARGKLTIDDVSFAVRRGEVLGIAGLMGSGRTELLQSIFGAFPRKRARETRMA